MAVAAWETYLKDRICEEFDEQLRVIDGSQVGRFVRKKLEGDLKRFFNPNSEKAKRLFLDYFEVDITQQWALDEYACFTSKESIARNNRKTRRYCS